MDLVTFSEGVQSIRIQEQENSTETTVPARPFVPRGEPVVRHTEALFQAYATNEESLRNFMTLPDVVPVEPWAFDDIGVATFTALTQQIAPVNDAQWEHTLRDALAILQALADDRKTLLVNLGALEKA